MLKKVLTTYANQEFCISINEEFKNHMSIHDGGEPCSGVLRHWGTKQELIKKLKSIIDSLNEIVC